jgi:hypothetical protein
LVHSIPTKPDSSFSGFNSCIPLATGIEWKVYGVANNPFQSIFKCAGQVYEDFNTMQSKNFCCRIIGGKMFQAMSRRTSFILSITLKNRKSDTTYQCLNRAYFIEMTVGFTLPSQTST